MVATLEDELKLEYEYRFTAMQKLKESLEGKAAQGQGIATGMGTGIMNHLYDTFAHNMKVFVNYALEHKPGTKPLYTKYLRWLYKLYENKDECIGLMCLSTLSQVINQAAMKMQSDHATMSDVASTIALQIDEEAHLQEFLNYLMEDKKDAKKAVIHAGLISGLKSRNSDF